MSVIGYDCNGKPLHPGDRCVLVKASNVFTTILGMAAGSVVVVIERGTFKGEDTVVIEPPPSFPSQYELHVSYEDIRKLPKDQHRTADRTFEDMMRGIKSLMPEENRL